MESKHKPQGKYLYHTECPDCGGSDPLALYVKDDGSIDGYCWGGCPDGEKYKDSSYIGGLTLKPAKTTNKETITQEQIDKVHAKTGFKANGYRGINDGVLKFLDIRTELDANGKVICRYYPIYDKDCENLIGYKRRYDPKDFTKGPLGYAGVEAALFAQQKYKSGGKYVCLVGGEEDVAAASEMLRAYQIKKGQGDYDPIPVVSPITGESGARKQIQQNYEWLNSFDKIILGFDNDKAGKEAMEKICKVLPQNKVYIAEWPLKDPNECLVKGKQKEFLNSFFKAKKHSPAGVLTSAELFSHIVERAKVEKIPLPPFLRVLQEMLAGGFPLAYIVNILSASGTGKSTIINELVYFWAFHSPHRVGIVSLEATAGEYGENILSRHLGKKIALIPTVAEKLEFLHSPDVIAKAETLWTNEVGDPRFYLVDDRGDVASLQKKIEYLIVACECKVIVVDPLQDILDELSTEDEAKFMRWQKKQVALHEVSFININHARKNGSGQKANSRGGELNEEDMQGSSTIFKSGGINIVIRRDKMAEDPIERNTIFVALTKARGTGITGPAGEIYYDNATHTLYDKRDYFKEELRETAPESLKQYEQAYHMTGGDSQYEYDDITPDDDDCPFAM